MQFRLFHGNGINERWNLAPIPLAFEHFTRERDVNFFTGFSTIALFYVFYHNADKAHVMTYWEGQSHTTTFGKPNPVT